MSVWISRFASEYLTYIEVRFGSILTSGTVIISQEFAANSQPSLHIPASHGKAETDAKAKVQDVVGSESILSIDDGLKDVSNEVFTSSRCKIAS